MEVVVGISIMSLDLSLGRKFDAARRAEESAYLLTQAPRHLGALLSPLIKGDGCGRGKAALFERGIKEALVEVDEV